MAKMVGDPATEALTAFEKLNRILEDIASPRIEISCSTIGLSDQPMNHYTGCFGLILKPLSLKSITHISNGDGGTIPTGDGRTRNMTNGRNSAEALLDAIINRKIVGEQQYNEICANDYQILGLFIALNSDEKQLISRILNHFEKQVRLFQLKCNGSELIDLHLRRPVSVSELYKEEK